MKKYRLKFTRDKRLRFLSHLDQQRVFVRALRRAEIPFAYSKGFNPHPSISFANAMSVGMTSESEYVDIGLNSDEFDAQTLKTLINDELPEGLEVLEVRELEEHASSLTKSVLSAKYEVLVENPQTELEELQKRAEDFCEQTAILIDSKTKKGKLKKKDLRPSFESLSFKNTDEGVVANIKILPVSGSLISPETVLKKFFENDELEMRTHRKSIDLEEIHHDSH